MQYLVHITYKRCFGLPKTEISGMEGCLGCCKGLCCIAHVQWVRACTVDRVHMVALACFLVNLAACLLVRVSVVFQPFSLRLTTLTAWGGGVFAGSASFRGLVRLPGVVVLLAGRHTLPDLGPQDGQTLLRTSGCAFLGLHLLIIINL